MSWSLIKRNWHLFSPLVAESWDSLTYGDLLFVDGDRARLVQLLGNRYALTPEVAERRVRLFEEGMESIEWAESGSFPRVKKSVH